MKEYWIYSKIKNGRDIETARNTMAKGNYPLSMTDCEVVGINGDCGYECPVFINESCEYQKQMEENQRLGLPHGTNI